ncbi:GntR family transcriptional regulator [Peribacillus frigoritolerans]|nr:GntR family transcriptional regulator [Peribacillus frigoritolerans]
MNSLEIDIYKKIKQAIIQQRLRPNMQLIEKDLAESFGVSPLSVMFCADWNMKNW